MIDNKILFILTPKFEASMPPIGVACLCAYLKIRGWNARVYDLNIDCYVHRQEKYVNHWNDEFQEFWNDDNSVNDFFNDKIDHLNKMFDFIEKEKPAYIGFSTHIANFCGSAILARKIKALWPEIKVIFGGVLIWQKLHMNRLDLKTLAIVDAFVIGEGEMTLYELLCSFKNGTDISQCPGIAYFRDDKLHLSAPRNSIVDPHDLPMPDYIDFDLKKYISQGKLLPLYISRGCINKCIFCEERKFWKPFRTKSGDQLFDEIKQLKAQFHDLEAIYFSESLFNGGIRQLRQFCHLLIESGIKVEWEANAIIRKEMDSDLLKLMAKAGCKRLMYGVETVSKTLLAYVGKIMSDKADIEEIVRHTANAGILVTLNFMFGLPGETEEDAQKNIDFVIRNKDYIDRVYPSWSFCYLTPLCDAYADPGKWGLKPITDVSFWESQDGTNSYPVRLARFERFCVAMKKEGITSSYVGDKLADREKKLGYYYCFIKDYSKAATYLLQAVKKEPWDTTLVNVLQTCLEKANDKTRIDTAFNHTDENWVNGVARSWATAFFVENTIQAKTKFSVGKRIVFANGDTRQIVSTKEDGNAIAVFLDGTPLDGTVVGYPHKFTIGNIVNNDKLVVRFLSKIKTFFHQQTIL